jgi:hypothetical protein
MAMAVLCTCDKPESKVELSCENWNVSAKIYKDKVVMDITNISIPFEQNEHIPQEFLEQGKTINAIADRKIFVMGMSAKNPDSYAFEYYKSFVEQQTNSDDDVSDSVGLVIKYLDQDKYIISGLSFGFSGEYKCNVKFNYDYKTRVKFELFKKL